MDKKYLNLIVLLKFVGALLLTIAFALYAAPFVSLKLGSASNNISGFQLAFDFDGEYCKTKLGVPVFFLSLMVAFLSLILSATEAITSTLAVMGKNISKNNSTKQLTLEQKKNIFINSTILIINSVIFFIVNLCAVSITGYNDNPLAHIGGGAVASGILLIIGEGLVCLSRILAINVLESKTDKTETNIKKSKSKEKSITEQLQEFKSLKEQGLISEDDYETKKKQLLNL